MDEYPSIVLDIGSSMVKAGMAGDDCPRTAFPAIIGRARVHHSMRDSRPKEAYIGDDAQRYESLYDLTYPVDRGIVTDWEDMELLLSHVLHNELKVNPKDFPILYTEPPLNPNLHRERLCETMFESLCVPAFYVQKQAILSMYASGRGSGVMLDSGDGVTHVLPVYEGYMTPHAVQRIDHAGKDLNFYLARLISAQQDHAFVTTSELELVRDIKEKHCYVCQDYQEMQAAKNCSQGTETYVLPDGKHVSLGNERFQAPEALFKPSLIGSQLPGFHELIFNCVMECDIDTRRDLCVSLILSGGNTMFTGLSQRLQKELQSLAPPALKMRVVATPERKYNVWIGGSILASLSTFQQMWISKQEYEEHGPTIIHKKCL